MVLLKNMEDYWETQELSQRTELEILGDRVLSLVKQSPPDIPEYGGSGPFWEKVDILEDHNVKYGDVKKLPPANDQHGTRITFRRKVFNESGEEIGEWEKHGFINKEHFQQPTLTMFEEKFTTPDHREEVVRVSLNKDGNVQGVQKINRENFVTIKDEGIRYSYDQNGEIETKKLVQLDPRGNITSERYLYRRTTERPDYPSPVVPEVPQSQKKKSLLDRLFRR